MRGDGSFVGDQRGVSAVLGFVLMFTLAVTTFVIYQSDVIPSQNEAIEHEHNEEMASELGALRSAAETTGSTGAPSSATIQTGPEYPERAAGLNAPGEGGTIRTGPQRTVRIEGFDNAVGDIWGSNKAFDTRLLHYEPQYNYYDDAASYTVENGRTVKRFANDAGGRRIGGTVVSGDRIDLLLMSGDFRTTGTTADIRLHAVSSASEYRTVTAESDATIQLPTTMSRTHWKDRVADNSNVLVDSYDATNETVMLEFDEGTYRIRVTKVTVGSASEPPVETVTKKNDPVVGIGETASLKATARDEYGNPVPGETVTFDEPDVPAATVEANDEGVATYAVERVTQREDVEASVSTGAGTETVTYHLGPGQPMTVTSKNQLFRGLDLEEFRLQNGTTVVQEGSNCVLGLGGGILSGLDCNEETYAAIELDATVRDADDNYRIRVFLQDFNRDGDFDDDRGILNPTPDDYRRVVIEEQDEGEIVNDALTPSAASDVLSGDGTDLLSVSSYEGSPDVDEVDVDDGELVVNDINGRVRIETET